ncbi:MAG: MAPEG family protein [Aromatoleum sp.]|nr:MAPEG family protein [Aromatoleum sp.]
MRLTLPALVTLAAVLVYYVIGFNVGRARVKYKIDAPAVTGNLDFERIYRVQMNTMEQFVAFLPALWLFAIYLSPLWASAFGVVWIVGRIVYAVGYTRAAAKRDVGFGITFIGFAVLWVGAAWGVIGALLQGM